MTASCFLRLRRHTAIKYNSDNIRALLTVGGRSIGQSPLEAGQPNSTPRKKRHLNQSDTVDFSYSDPVPHEGPPRMKSPMEFGDPIHQRTGESLSFFNTYAWYHRRRENIYDTI